MLHVASQALLQILQAARDKESSYLAKISEVSGVCRVNAD